MVTILEIQEKPFQEGTARLKLDAQASLADILEHPQCPVFLQNTLRGKLTWQKRSEYDVSKTLAAPGLAPQWVGALLAWGTWAALEDGTEQPLAELLAAGRKSKEITALYLPLNVPGRNWADARTGSSASDFPIVWAMAVIDTENGAIKDARLALSGVWNQSVALANAANLMTGKSLSEAIIQQIVDAVEGEVQPKGDYRGGVEYRKAMAGVMTRRTLQACMEGESA